MKTSLILIAGTSVLLAGCVGRTGKVGKPIAAYYSQQLAELQLGESTPDDLQRVFTLTVTNGPTTPLQYHPGQPQQTGHATVVKQKKTLVFLKQASIEDGKKVEIWELPKGGGMDIAAFVVWGFIAYNKDQELDFRFEDGKLVSYQSIVIPDPVEPSPPPTASKSPK